MSEMLYASTQELVMNSNLTVSDALPKKKKKRRISAASESSHTSISL